MNTNAIELLARAKDMAAREVLRRGLKGLRAEIAERALVDHYHHKLVSDAQEAKAWMPRTKQSLPDHFVNVWPLVCGIEIVTDGDPRGDDYTVESPTDADLYEAMKRLIDANQDVIEEYLADIMADRKQQNAGEIAVQRAEDDVAFGRAW